MDAKEWAELVLEELWLMLYLLSLCCPLQPYLKQHSESQAKPRVLGQGLEQILWRPDHQKMSAHEGEECLMTVYQSRV